jgi:hypothetical protein
MKCPEKLGSGAIEIYVTDRRRSANCIKSRNKVWLVRKTGHGIIFQADWRFPVPACRRRYHFLNRELSVEECGKIPNRDIFEFSGIFLDRKG